MDWMTLVHGAGRDTPRAAFGPGDEVRVWYRILEQGKERLGQFEGLVIRFRGAGPSKTFTVRRVTHGEGVERVFPVDAKIISKIELLRQGKVKRSRLYFLRTIVGKTRIAAADSSPGPDKLLGEPKTIESAAEAKTAVDKPEGVASTTAQSTSSPAPRA